MILTFSIRITYNDENKSKIQWKQMKFTQLFGQNFSSFRRWFRAVNSLRVSLSITSSSHLCK